MGSFNSSNGFFVGSFAFWTFSSTSFGSCILYLAINFSSSSKEQVTFAGLSEGLSLYELVSGFDIGVFSNGT